MNPEDRRPPTDAELDRLLGSRLRRTTPEFEQRWRLLRAELAGARPAAGPVRWPRWLLWPGLTTAALAVLAILFVARRAPAPPPGAQPVSFEELIALDAALQPARALLEAENRDALLHLPAQPRG